MERSFAVAQVTGAIAGGNPTPPNLVKLTKPDTNQAVTIPLDGAVQIDLSSIADTPVTFVHVGDRLVILFDNKATVALEPFFGSDGTPLSNITVEVAPDRSVSGTEFASLFPITQDPSVLPTAGDGPPASGADFATATIDQLLGTPTALALLGTDSPTGNSPGPNGTNDLAINALNALAAPTLTVHAVAGSEDKPIGLSITDALGVADQRASLGNITVTGIPAGVTFNQGTLSPDGKTLTLTPAQLAGLTLVSDGEEQHFDLSVTATTVDGGDAATEASTTKSLHVDVTPVADAPLLTVPTSLQFNHFAPVDQADARATLLLGLSNNNEAVGTFVDEAGRHGLLDQGGNLSTFDAPDSTMTQVKAVNDSGTIAGSFVDSSGAQHGFVREGTQFTQIDFPGASSSSTNGINNAGAIVGTFVDASGNSHGFLDQGGHFTQVDVPGATLTHALGINDQGQIVGFFDDAAGNEHGFVDTNGTFKTIDGSLPGATSAVASGINDNGQIVGVFADATGAAHGFLLDPDGTSTVIDVPGATFTDVAGINNSGEIDGSFVDSSGEHGFTATGGTAVGNEDTQIALGISAALGEADADAILKVQISGIPAGVTFSAGTLSPDGTTLTLTPAQLAGLTLTGDGEAQQFNLSVTATTVDGGNTATAASVSKTLLVDVTPVADAPVLTLPATTSPEVNFNTIDKNGAQLTELVGVNNNNESVGFFFDVNNLLHGLIEQNGSLSTFDAPGSFDTGIRGVNDSGTFAGLFFDNITGAQHGFLQQGAQFTQIDAPSASATLAFGINNSTELVGEFTDLNGNTHGFLDQGGTFTQIDVPGAVITEARAINDAGTIVGDFVDANSVEHGFVDSNGTTTRFDVKLPGVVQTEADGINDKGQIVGFFNDATGEHGFLLDPNGALTVINDPEASATQVLGINNNSNTLAGAFVDVNGIAAHGFTETSLVSTVAGNEDTPIALGIQAALGEVDPDAVLTVTVAGLPSGVTLSNTKGDPLTILEDGSITLTPAQLAGLSLTSNGETQHFDLKITATTVDGGDQATAGIASQTLHVNVTPVAGAPVLNVTNASGSEDHAIALAIQPSLSEPDADAAVTLVTITNIPTGVTFSAGALSQDGQTLTLTPDQLAGLTLTSDGEVQHFNLTVKATTVDGGDTATAASNTQTLQVDVTPVADAPTLTVGASGPTTTFFPDQSNHQSSFLRQVAINDAGTIVGTIDEGSAVRGFELPAGATTASFFNFAQFIDAFDINSSGEVVGDFVNASRLHGFLLSPDGTVTSINLTTTGTVSTAAIGINDAGVIVGNAFVNGVGFVGFVDRGGAFSTINVEGRGATTVAGIDNAGDIVGSFSTAATNSHGFIFLAGQAHPTFIDVPGAAFTVITGINNSGVIVGFFNNGGPQDHNHGFIDNGGTITTFDLPGGGVTTPSGINDKGQLVGTFTDNSGTVGFETTIPGIGLEDTPIALGIQAALGEADADAVLTVTITGIPAGVKFSAGTLSQDGKTLTLTPDQLANLTLTSDGEVQHFDLMVTATTVDGGDAATAASTSQTLHIDVTPVADAPVLNVPNATGNEDQPIALHIQPLLAEADADAAITSITTTGLPTSGVTLSNTNGDLLIIDLTGSITLTPAQLAGLALTSDGETQHFDLKVTALAQDGNAVPASTTATLHVDVTPVADQPTLAFTSGIVPAPTEPGVTLPPVVAVSGNEETPIALTMKAGFGEVDPDAVLSVTISGVAAGATLNHGTIIATDANGVTTWSVDPADLSTLALTSDGEAQHFILTVTVTAVDGGDAAKAASIVGTAHVNVTPVSDPPVLAAADVSAASPTLAQGGTVALTITPHFEVDGDAIETVTIAGLPAGASLVSGTTTFQGGNGLITLTPDQLLGLTLQAPPQDGSVITLTIQAHAQDAGAAVADSAIQTISIPVAPVPPNLQTANASGTEDQAIALPIQVSLADGSADPDASIKQVTISGIPAGATLANSAGPLTITNGSVTLTSTTLLQGLTLTGNGEVQHFDLTVTATETDGGITATTSATEHVDVTPAVTTPTFAQTSATVMAVDGGQINIGPDISPIFAPPEAGETDVTNSITISGLPAGATIFGGTVNSDGSVTVQQANLADVKLNVAETDAPSFTLTVTATSSDGGVNAVSATHETITINVNPQAEAPRLFIPLPGFVSDVIDVPLSLTFPLAPITEVNGVSDPGVIVGTFVDAAGTHGFIDKGGVFTKIAPNFSTFAEAFGVNDAGTVVGTFQDPFHGNATEGFITNGSNVTNTIIFPGATETDARAINNAGQVVGFYKDSHSFFHGFRLDPSGAFTTIDDPFGTNTKALGINDAGQIVGSVVIAGDPGFNQTDGFIDTNGKFTFADGQSTTTPPFNEADAINNIGQVSGFSVLGTGTEQAFIGQIPFSPFGNVSVKISPVPLLQAPVGAVGINDNGQLFGSFHDGRGISHGFITEPGITGSPNTAIPVTINAAPAVTDADAPLTVTISGIPVGVTFNQGVTSNGGATVTLQQADLGGLTLTGNGATSHFDLTVTASVTDGGTSTASTSSTVHVEVAPGLSSASPAHAALTVAPPTNEGASIGGAPAAGSTLQIAGTTKPDATGGITFPTAADFHQSGLIDFSALSAPGLGHGSTAPTAGGFAPIQGGAGGNYAMMPININGGLGGVHAGDVVAAVLEHAQHTAQLTAHT